MTFLTMGGTRSGPLIWRSVIHIGSIIFLSYFPLKAHLLCYMGTDPILICRSERYYWLLYGINNNSIIFSWFFRFLRSFLVSFHFFFSLSFPLFVKLPFVRVPPWPGCPRAHPAHVTPLLTSLGFEHIFVWKYHNVYGTLCPSHNI